MQVEPNLAVLMTDQKFTSGRCRGQYHHQRGEHPGRFLGIAVAREEAAFIVDQQLVELGLHRLSDAKAVTHAGQDCAQCPRPAPALDPDLVRADLPRPPNRRVDQGLLSPPEGRPFGSCNELFGLGRQKRQCDLTDTLHLQLGRKEFDRAGGEEVAGPTDRGQDSSQFVRDGGHGCGPYCMWRNEDNHTICQARL